MQSAMNDATTQLITAAALKEMTITKEDLLKKQKENVLDALMSTMVKLAQENGETSYMANLNPKFDVGLLNDIVNELTGLGYKVSTESKTDTKLGPFLTLAISWS